MLVRAVAPALEVGRVARAVQRPGSRDGQGRRGRAPRNTTGHRDALRKPAVRVGGFREIRGFIRVVAGSGSEEPMSWVVRAATTTAGGGGREPVG